MNENYIRSSKPFFPKEDIENIIADIAATLEQGILRNGKNMREFEKAFSTYIGIKDAVAFDSDSNALETALRYFNVKNSEVIVSTNSFISIPNSVVYAGGKVVFADIKTSTLSMDPNSLRQNISSTTRGVIVTHIAGFPNPDLNEIMEICTENKLFLIEDATHAAGATIKNQKVGTFGDAAVLAFTPTKVLTTGEGAMLVTNNTKLCEEARLFRFYGSGPGKTMFVNLGRHMILPEISAILGIYQLKRIEEFIEKRNRIAKIYNEEIDKLETVSRLECAHGNRSSYYKYPLILNKKTNKNQFTQSLEKNGIETGNIFYPPCHLQTVYQKSGIGYRAVKLETAEDVLSRTITLPIHAAMSDNDAKYVIASVKSLVTNLK